MAQFDHPHIAYLVGITTQGFPYMLHMAYCEHGSLLTFLRDRSGFLELGLTSKLVMMHHISDGMQYLEWRQFVHRDLACRNILVASDFKCKITDFGLTRELESRDQAYVATGNAQIPLRWSAPEALAKRLFSPASVRRGVILCEGLFIYFDLMSLIS
jgi:Eph receptor A1